jgi:hypothetical protein
MMRFGWSESAELPPEEMVQLVPGADYGWPEGIVMSGRRSLIKGYFWRCADRGCGHVFGLVRGEFDPPALMLSADPLPRSRQRA